MAANTKEIEAKEKPGNQNRFMTAALLVLIAVVGLALRLYRLPEQSIWMDEFLVACNLNAPDVLSYEALFDLHFPAHAAAPLYYLLQYYYTWIAGTSLLVLRLLPISFGVLSILLMFFLGRRLYGTRAGLVAALCMALSPQHIWFNQEIRTYALLTFLVMVSVYALVRAIQDRRWYWWVLHSVANALLAWTHLLAVLYLPVVGIWLFLKFRSRFRYVVWWTAIQFLLLVPWTVWVLSLQHLHCSTQSWGINVVDIGRAILASDLVECHTSLLPPWKTDPPLFESAIPLLAWRKGFNLSLLAAFGIGMAWLLWQALKPPWRWIRRRPPDSRTTERAEWAVFLLLLIFVPGLTLGILEKITKLILSVPAYTMYNTIGLYIGVGAALSVSRWRPPRFAAVAALMLLFGYQLAIFLPSTTRADWRGAARHIKEHANPNDLVIDFEPCMYAGHSLEYYLKDAGYSVRQLTTLQAACDESASFYERLASTPSSPAEKPCVWLAFELQPLYWTYRSVPSRTNIGYILETGFTPRGLSFSSIELPGQLDILLLRIQPAKDATPRKTGEPVSWLEDVDCERIVDEVGIVCPNEEARQNAIAALRAEIPIWPPDTVLVETLHAMDLIDASRPDLAEALACDALKRVPDFAMAHFVLGMTLVIEGRDDEARAPLEKALKLHWALRRIYGPFVQRLYNAKKYGDLHPELERLNQMGWQIFMPVLRAVCDAKEPPLLGQSAAGFGEKPPVSLAPTKSP